MTDLQASNAGLGSSDQAAGLRQLFGEGFARVWCLVSSLPGDPTVMVALGAANALRRAGQRVLLVDEVPLTNRNLLLAPLFRFATISARLLQVRSGLKKS